jgi:hypothetical protein
MAVLGSNSLNHSADLLVQRAGTTRITVTSTGLTLGGDVVLSTEGTATNQAVRADRSISTGDGLSGGGNLTINRTFTVDSTVVRTSGNQTIAGTKTFPSTVAFTNVNQLLLKNGTASNVTTIFRNDGADQYILLSNASTAPNGSWNTLRPFQINLTTGLLSSANSQSFSGTTTVNGTLVLGNAGTATNHAVRADRTISTGGGLSGGGNLTANRTLSVDSSVVRTTGNQTIGGTKTFNGLIEASGSAGGMSVNTQGSTKLEVKSAGVGNAAYMTFHIPGQYAVRFGLDVNNNLRVGGWSLGNAAYTLLHQNNVNSFAVGLSGDQNIGGNKNFTGELRVSTDRFRVSSASNDVFSSNIFNNGTTSGSNVHVRGGDFLIERNISSIKYKHSVETIDSDISDYVVRNIRPVWYRSKCANDTPDWSWYGFIAEEVAEIEPRLCHWDAPIIEEETDEYEQLEPYENEMGELITPDPVKIVRKYQDPNAPKEVEGVMYERFTVLLVDQVQKLIKKVESLEEKINEFEKIN